MCESITKHNDSKVVFQFELLFGSRMGVAPGSPGPKSRTQSDASEAGTTKADLSLSDYWALMRPWSSTYTTVWKGLDSFPHCSHEFLRPAVREWYRLLPSGPLSQRVPSSSPLQATAVRY